MKKEIRNLENNLISYKKEMRVLFCRKDIYETAADYITGLLSKIERKNRWQLAEGLGKTRPYQIQRLVGKAIWDEDKSRDFVREHTINHLGIEGTFVIDDTGFLKKGKNQQESNVNIRERLGE